LTVRVLTTKILENATRLNRISPEKSVRVRFGTGPLRGTNFR